MTLLRIHKNRILSHLFGLRGNIRTPSIGRWKARGRLPIVIIELFHYLLRLRRYERKCVEVGVFRRKWFIFGEHLTGNGVSPTNHCWCQKTRVIAVSCGIII